MFSPYCLYLNITADHLGKHISLSTDFLNVFQAVIYKMHVDDGVVCLRIEGEGVWNAKIVPLMTSMFVFSRVFCFFSPLQVGISHSTAVNAVLLGNIHFYLGFCSL